MMDHAHGTSPTRGDVRALLLGRPWLWSFVAAGLVWAAIYVTAGRDPIGTLTAAALVGSVLVVAGIGEMFVVTGGNGNIDLSIPSTMTLAGFVSVGVMSSSNSGLIAGLGAAIAVGCVIAAMNMIAILVIQVPPIIATLAVGFMAASASQVISNDFSASPSPVLVRFVNGSLLGIPLPVMAAVLLALVAATVLRRTRFGRSLQAVGQSYEAARLSGVRVNRVVASTYLISGVLASLAGVLLAANSGGVQLDIATPYLLNTIAVVVLGGTFIGGGRSFVSGIWGATLLLTLLVTLLTVLNIAVATQNIIKGLLIVAVLSIAGGKAEEV